ncbi:iron-siderophore ABC transporter substrate-binding protein [Saccharopolyspora sp. HNM0983]|uniref:Iron-siderophore ABC transporter substrate-binding protein n=1 Tax=Saccharopolyspora montiporae TaxID=2781240 RepID=A0A929FYV3_9PSEU|nr:iron-siderophore ABC transporter substrate-binding protein [Saccharopolyspora sp. HNM0983]MBE9373734.1 iron-siderophore ABC transporter substrate-binding protein [Saccharopolyspora sp. HNM0983]
MPSTVFRPRGLLIAVLLGALLAASGCADSGPPPADPPLTPATGRFPATVPTAFGDVTVPEEPQRVVALGWGDAETAVALGVRPVGAADWLEFGGDGLGPWMQQRYDTPPEMLGTMEVSLERIAALQPDVILDTRSSGDPQRYEQLSKLGVPVIAPPADAPQYLTTWQDQLDMVGAALGRTEQAAQLRAGLDAKFARAAREHPEFRGTEVALGSRTAAGYGVYLDGSNRVEFLRALGFANSRAIQRQAAPGQFTMDISPERLDLLDAELTTMFTIYTDPAEVTGDPLFRGIPSVQDGRSVLLAEDEPAAQAISSGTAPGLSFALDETVPEFAAALSR